MHRYVLIDQNDNEFTVEDNTLKILSRSYSIDLDVIERSFKSGANLIGIPRQQSTTLDFQYDTNLPEEQQFRAYINNLLYWLNKVVKIKDTVNNIETELVLESNNINYDPGGFNLGTTANAITFRQLKPYWRDVDYTIIEQSGLTADIIVIQNNGFIETPAIIEIIADEQITKYSIRVQETGNGIVVEDIEFGTQGLNNYIVDNEEGVIELNNINRNQKIRGGTGFFNLQVGVNTLEFSLTGSAEILIKYKERYYI